MNHDLPDLLADGSADLAGLETLSAELGRDRSLIQAAGGNTSIKIGDTLWVKASGKRLDRAGSEPTFVPVRLSGVRRRVRADEADPVTPERLAAPGCEDLRPSIETSLHALMPHPVVLHVHSVDAVAWAVQPDAAEALAQRLDGLAWAWVPYVRPGLPLTRAVALLMAERSPDALLMQNHGLVVGGASLTEARARLREIVARLALPARPGPAGNSAALAKLADGSAYRLPQMLEAHSLGTDPISLRHAERGTLYPDHVVFLGAASAVVREGQGLDAALHDFQAGHGSAPKLVLVPGCGVLLERTVARAGEEMAVCLADVLARLGAEATVQALSAEQVDELLNWDAEQYRVSLSEAV